MSRRYPPEVHEFLMSFILGHTAQEISEAVSERFGIEMTTEHVKLYKNNHRIRSGTPCGVPSGSPTKLFPAEVVSYIRDNYKGVGTDSMADLLNSQFGTSYTRSQIRAFYQRRNLRSGVDARFQKGNVPPNKGKKGMPMHPNAIATQFKKGSTPPNKMPIGSIVQKGDGYLWKKIGERARDWKQLHRLVWEEAHGPIPQGYMLTFLDGDRLNVTLDNLALISRAEHAVMVKNNLRFSQKEATESGIALAKLKIATYQAKKRRKRHDTI